MKPIVVIGFIGTQLDSGRGAGRWEKWRPTLSLAQHPDMVVARMELIHTPRHTALAEMVKADIEGVSPETEVRLVPLDIEDPWDFGEVYTRLYDWARAYPFDTAREQYWAHITTGTHVAQICMFLLAESRIVPGVLAQTSPPRRQREGDPGSFTLIDLDRSRYDAIAQRHAADQREAVAFLKRGIATRNARFNALIDEVERVAVRSRAPILLVGPTGAGKSFLARRMFELKKARHQVSGPFVEVNCATLRGDGAASSLFGHKKGAFTGAASERAGLLRSADQGVLFLDEIGELGADEQAMLLMAIEEKRFYPVGADHEVHSDFQLVAGTNRDLRGEVAAGRFREDLFARINLWTYELPGLAQRPEDIEPNIEHLLAQHAQQAHRGVRFNAEARAAYLRFAQGPDAPWHGNFRDLSASITRLATLAEGARITEDLVQAELARLRWLWAREDAAPAHTLADDDLDLDELLGTEQAAALDLFDRLQLEAVLRVCRRSRTLSDAGRQLFQASRMQRSVVNDADRLRKYLAKHRLSWERIRA
ncbi:RNA repair transcriptional activator RtcR [Xenophilus arseniciresistens]|uniref:RNA repair transcriptional activator RtcR n=1 Tax=Xenophilus arseniciresistens TaxID=1283306 RepID=A0AAE3SXX7_9BURK|nr:RNA repair transcriptional activator RtcR [Xenophilus arseniciresistens]MDA7415414.1 RNA repair transcriptional activator RtcR [Xenophilus arseniciresistens]